MLYLLAFLCGVLFGFRMAFGYLSAKMKKDLSKIRYFLQ